MVVITFDISPKVFSHFVFNRTCTGELSEQYIEPLALLGRNPAYCFPNRTVPWDVLDKGFVSFTFTSTYLFSLLTFNFH